VLNVYRSNRLERLADALAEVLRERPAPPFEPERIAVQSQGMSTWLSMELARRLGILANTPFPFPRDLLEEILATTLGTPAEKMASFRKENLTWRVMALLPGLMSEEAFEPLRRYLGGASEQAKRFQLAARIAHLFDQYAVYRPELVLKWETQSPVDWQSRLWRELVDRSGACHLAHLARQFEEAVRAGGLTENWPRRISLFGISTLPPLYLRIFAALSARVDVNLFLLSPSREFWADTRSRREMFRELARQRPGDLPDEPAAAEALFHLDEGHPLLGGLGRVGRHFQAMLENFDYVEPPSDDLYEDPLEEAPASLLTRLQSGMLCLRGQGAPDGPPGDAVSPDESIAIHSCYGPMREVEALRDRLLDLFSRDRTLKPHQVAVMMPDVETFAPLIEAVFGARENGRPAIPFRVSDRPIREEIPAAEAVLTLLDLTRSRFKLPEVIDLLKNPIVHSRFGLEAERLETALSTLQELGVRWGIDAAHRQRFDQPGFVENTWRFGLDRLLLGLALPGHQTGLFRGVLPATGIEGHEADWIGALADFAATLFEKAGKLAEPRSLPAWACDLDQAMAALTAETSTSGHQLVRAILDDLVAKAAGAGLEEPLELEVIRRVLAGRFGEERSPAGFLSGGVTFCNLLPMRSIPFRVICLMGLDDAEFPRLQQAMTFDLMAKRPRLGDRSTRDDDRYLFLEALLSARERLLIFYRGQHLQDGSPIPPSTVVSELIDAAIELCLPGRSPGETLVGAEADRLRNRLVVRHPLQPFSRRYFDGTDDRLFSYSSEYLAGAKALVAGSIPPEPFLAGPGAGGQPPEKVALEEWLHYFRKPTETLLRRRLGIRWPEPPGGVEGREPLELDSLQNYQLGDRLLDRLTGADAAGEADAADLYAHTRAAGQLPLGTPGRCHFDLLWHKAKLLAEQIRPLRAGMPLEPVRFELEVRGVRLAGTIGSLWLAGRIMQRFGRLDGTRWIELWLPHLILEAVGWPGERGLSFYFGRDGKKTGEDSVTRVVFGHVPDPAAILDQLMDIYLRGLSRPLPLFPKSGLAYAREWREGGQSDASARHARALEKAGREWRQDYGEVPGENDDPYVRLAFPEDDPLAEPDSPAALEFGRLSLTVFGPMLESEVEAP